MKFYDCQTAPSPRRARIFIAEKGLTVETVEVNLRQREQLTDTFKEINPRCTVPVLQLDDGTCLTENIGIATYLEAMVPEPRLMGTTPEERGLVSSWNARVELEGLWPIADALRNRSKRMAGRAVTGPTNYEQIPELAERGLARGVEFFAMLDQRLADSEYLAGSSFSLADITALVVVDFAGWVKLGPEDGHSRTKRWYEAVSTRQSASV